MNLEIDLDLEGQGACVCGIVSTIGQKWVPHWRNLKEIFYYGKDSRVTVTRVFYVS